MFRGIFVKRETSGRQPFTETKVGKPFSKQGGRPFAESSRRR
jgi:hypothetical protein